MCETLSSNNIRYLDVPDRVENDENSYRFISLNNGLKALLISDPQCASDSESEITLCSAKDMKNVGLPKKVKPEEINKVSVSSAAAIATAPPSITPLKSAPANTNFHKKSSNKENFQNSNSSLDDATTNSLKSIATLALLVDVGYFRDPPNVDGLAHLVEHMIFMGSEKYPLESEFDSFIIRSGGRFNGETDCENSFFYFNINDDYLEDALDRFTELFSRPLMLKEAMKNERFVIESEFKSKMQSDVLRREQILASLANPDHPCSRFGWGNLKTLKENIDDEKLYEVINEFRLKYYSAERMYVCLQADRKLKELQELVVKYFSKIPRRNCVIEDLSLFNHENAFRKEFFENVIFVRPVFDISSLEITWCLPAMIKDYKSKPYQYITYILVHQGCGSLCAYLRSKLWGFEIAAGVEEKVGFEFNSLYCLFEICIYLTEEGFKHLKDVLEVTFAYIKILEEHGPDEDLFIELQKLVEMTAHTYPDSYPLETVFNLKYYPHQDVLTAKKLLLEYNPEAIWKIIKILNEPKFNLMITSKKHYDGVVYDKKEKWFGTEYGIIKMPDEWLELWNNCKQFPELFFPKENKFLIQDTSRLFNHHYSNTKNGNGNDENDNNLSFINGNCNDSNLTYPIKILDIDVCELWYKSEEYYNQQTGYMCFHFITPLVVLHARNELLMELWIVLIKFRLISQLSEALQAGYFYDIYISDRGFTLEISGYPDKLYFMADTVAKTMTDINGHFSEDEICLFLKEIKDYYKNMLIDPESLNNDLRYGTLQKIWWLSIEKYNLVSTINLEQIEAFALLIFREIRIKALIQGNIKERDAIKITTLILDTVNCCRIQNPEVIQPKICKLPIGNNFIICKSFNAKDVNTVVTNVYQIGHYTLKTKCILDLIMMIVSQPLFDNLRTKEKLAYAVSFDVTFNYGILDYSITVISQEDKFNANYVEQRIEAFRNEISDIIDRITQDEYSHYRNSLTKQKLYDENDLSDEMNRYCKEIMYDEYMFDRREKEADCIKKITKDEILEFLKREMEKYRKLSIQVVGHASKNNNQNSLDLSSTSIQSLSTSEFSVNNGLQLILDDANSINDIACFKNGLCLYL